MSKDKLTVSQMSWDEEIEYLKRKHERLKIKYDVLLDNYNKLEQRIDKAIEYIETATICPQSIYHYRNCLYEILKGEDK